ncbi:DNA polymerase III subunit delta [Rhodoferax sp. 4810]|uniref:DNA polymerase III subunit delta n=1 Tax=Thiospirillum jenense TaxID=1653858 RepID=A0A839HBW1_9GAMM|nr:DNA polymerase III subunit delta [Thiospirillum jenense]MBB1073132.1 DNA polymerase III subunit delta [Rhodoferax jenense]MBB1124707.1 DNA polymerase III subunit delta [Thiospirillum jenense]
MRVSSSQLSDHLKRKLAPVYLLCGNEPLQFNESLDAVRTHAHRLGFTERHVLEYQKDFDWNMLIATANARSLFSAQQMIELRIGEQKIGVEGGNAIRRYCDQLNQDVLLLVMALGLDGKDLKTKWVQTIDEVGVVIQTREPANRQKLIEWLENRLRSKGFSPTPEVASLLADQTEGNLLAADQEITKLALVRQPGVLDVAGLRAAITDSARFDLYDLTAAAIAGDRVRTRRVLQMLMAEGTAEPLVLWVLSRELRALAALAFAQQARQELEPVFHAYQVWDNRRPLLLAVLKRHSLAQLWQLLLECATVDQAIKGRAAGDPWALLAQIADTLAMSAEK